MNLLLSYVRFASVPPKNHCHFVFYTTSSLFVDKCDTWSFQTITDLFCIYMFPIYTKHLLLTFHDFKRHLSILSFSPNCLVKTTCQVSLDSRGCIFHQLPDRFRSKSFSDISSLNPPLSIEALTTF